MMTAQEASAKYGHIPLKFVSYYKYDFNFSGEQDGVQIHASFGGNSDVIYRYEVSVSKLESLGNIEDQWHFVVITDHEEKVFEYYDPA